MHVLDSAWDAIKREFESASVEKQLNARRQITGELNRLFRRFRHYEDEEQWLAALRDGAALASHEFAIFTVANGELRLRARQNIALEEPVTLAVSSANAFRAAIESREPVTSLRRAGEVGAVLAREESSARAHLFPIANGGRVVAVVFAAGDETLDLDGMELISSMASAVLERQANQTIHAQIAPLVRHVDEQRGEGVRELPGWSTLSESDRRLHSKAQRFSRVAVAEMQLARPEACRAGREQNNLYLFLQSEIDKARESYRRQFMTISSMVDYLHLELLCAVGGDERKLGADYPGHLV
ncbi:MAG TPA: hypothetical protein VH477_05125 [Bryobacteraceae bacterium]|jgi:hypothetical protein